MKSVFQINSETPKREREKKRIPYLLNKYVRLFETYEYRSDDSSQECLSRDALPSRHEVTDGEKQGIEIYLMSLCNLSTSIQVALRKVHWWF